MDIAGFYNEILTGVSYENYDLLRTDMMRCKNVKGFQYLQSESTATSTSVQPSRPLTATRRIKQESYSAYAQDALYLTDKWIAVAGTALPVLHPVRGQRPSV